MENKKIKRPISPYLSVYRFQANSFFSIFTRISGLILLAGITLPVVLFVQTKTCLSSYFWYSIIFFFLKSSYTELSFSFLVFAFILSLIFHVVAAVRYTLSKTFWPTPYQSEFFHDPLEYFLYVPMGLFINAILIYLIV